MIISQQKMKVNGITLNVATAGEGPLVLMCHGFPELWFSWRAQITAIAEAGYRVAAPDMRGYGESDKPEAVEDYSIFHLVGDTVDLVKQLGEKTAIIVGHDWGAYVAWMSALFRPDVFPAVAALSVPHTRRPEYPPMTIFRAMTEKQGMEFYQVWFQEPGVAEKAYESDVEGMQTGMMYGCSGEASEDELWQPVWQKGDDPAEALKRHARRPSWLTEEELEQYLAAFKKGGYRGPLNWYRNIDRNWELTAAYQNATVNVPALFMIGEKDMTLSFSQPAIKFLDKTVPKLTKTVVVPGAGHWLQQEAVETVNKELLEFLGKTAPIQG